MNNILGELKELRNFLNDSTAEKLYSYIVVFCTNEYYIELNPLYIQRMKIKDEFLELSLQNNRLMRLKITPEFNYKKIKTE